MDDTFYPDNEFYGDEMVSGRTAVDSPKILSKKRIKLTQVPDDQKIDEDEFYGYAWPTTHIP